MPKKIVIIGGGISGLAVLHFLKKRYPSQNDAQIFLFEKNDYAGGTARTISKGPYVFEAGPNGFLSSRLETLEFVKEIGLETALIAASNESSERFIFLRNTLHALPLSPIKFFSFKPISFSGKFRILGEFFVKKGNDPDETIYDFGVRRLGVEFTRVILDPFVLGVFGGDVAKLNLKAAIPRIYEIEQTYGSLLKGSLNLALKARGKTKEKTRIGQPKGILMSFKKGMGQLSESIAQKYADSVRLNNPVQGVQKSGQEYLVTTKNEKFTANEVYVCTPAYHASQLLAEISPVLSECLMKIYYAPVAVAGFAFEKSAFLKPPKGFGYLIPSSEKKNVLGAVFSSCIFPGRSDQEHVLIQAMIGGAANKNIAESSREELAALAAQELQSTLKIKGPPVETFFAFWPKAIPQYTVDYLKVVEDIKKELAGLKGLSLVSNYIGGVSLNDCILNAKKAVGS